MVPHHKVPALRHLVRQLDVALPQGLFRQVRLLQGFAVNGHIAVFVHVHPFPRHADHPLHQDFVVVVEGDYVAALVCPVSHGGHNVPIDQSGGHGGAVDAQNGQQQVGNQHGGCGYYHQHSHGAPQHFPIASPVLFPLQLCFQLLDRGQDGGRLVLLFHP